MREQAEKTMAKLAHRKSISRTADLLRGIHVAESALFLSTIAFASVAAESVKKPAVVQFGRYFADGKGESFAPIEWLVLDERGGKSVA